MPNVFGTLRNASDDATDGIVTVRLITSVDGSRPPAFLAGGVTVISAVQPPVAVDGDWDVDLISNLDPSLSPSGTYYEVIQQAKGESARGFAIQVPLGGGPYAVTSIVVDAPTAISSSGVAQHLAANPSHQADHVGFTPAGGVTATNVQDAVVQAAAGTGYLHTQIDAAFVWTANHNRGAYMGGIYVEESTGDELAGYERDDPDPDTLVLTFPVEVSGFIRAK